MQVETFRGQVTIKLEGADIPRQVQVQRNIVCRRGMELLL